MKKHPIQLIQLQYKELSVCINNLEVCEQKEIDLDVTYEIGTNNYDEKSNRLLVGFRCTLKEKGTDSFELVVELLALFEIGDEFESQNVKHFAQNNAPLILLPYVRESVYSLSTRANLKIILPLSQVPTNI